MAPLHALEQMISSVLILSEQHFFKQQVANRVWNSFGCQDIPELFFVFADVLELNF